MSVRPVHQAEIEYRAITMRSRARLLKTRRFERFIVDAITRVTRSFPRETIGYLTTATPFGRPRRWFQCPGCARRCRVLYSGKRFRCRLCHRLRYECQYESTTQRANRRSRKIRKRLGGSNNLMEEFPSRPSGMHRATYWRLEELDDDMQSIWARGVFELLSRRS